MYLEALLLGFIIGAIRNGRFMYFNATRFKGWTLMFASFFIYIIPYFLHLFKIPFEHTPWISYAAIVVVAGIVVLNLDKLGMKIILVGLLLNLVVMGFYQGAMPIDVEKMENLGYSSFAESVRKGNVVNYIDISEVEGFQSYLGKMIPLPKVYPLSKVLSLGDILISIGIVLLIQNEMLLKSTRMKGSMLHYSYKSKF